MEKMKCPVCGESEFAEEDDFDICQVCHWENSGLQHDEPNCWGGANRLSLNQARAVWKKHRINLRLIERKMVKCACCGKRTVTKYIVNGACPECGWLDDEGQNQNPELKEGANAVSLNEAKAFWETNGVPLGTDLSTLKDRKKCECCGNLTLSELSFGICPICGWDDSHEGNLHTLKEAREIWQKEHRDVNEPIED
jgi:Zn finger protein HypA/HybF involved in hydrogenase expression